MDNHAIVRRTLPAGREQTMSAVIIEHVDVADLPESWRAKLPAPRAERVTVRIEEEDDTHTGAVEAGSAVDLLFGMWRNREDLADVEGYVRKLRAPRYNPDGSRKPG
jgi:hypothetical protein